MSSLKHYKLVDKKPVEVSFWAWADSSKDIDRVDSTKIGDVRVSTVFIGLGDCFSGRPFFETMIFGGPLDMYQERCSTWEQAEEQHAEAVRLHTESLEQRRIKEDYGN